MSRNSSSLGFSPLTVLTTADEALLQLVRVVRDSGYEFTTVTPATHERVNSRPENEWACDLKGVFGWSRLFHPDILPPEVWKLMRLAEAAVAHGDAWKSSVRLSSLSGQLFLHSAYPTTEADAVFFGPDTYRFAAVIQNYFASNLRPVRRIVDIGCGAGPGAILCAGAHPQAEVLAVDINDVALGFTRLNAILAGTPNVEPRHSNLLSDVEGEFDLIVANPPYLVDPAERAYRHGGGILGADLSLAIVESALERLAPQGILLLYTGAAIMDGLDPFQAEIKKRLARTEAISSYREIDPDVFGEELSSDVYRSADRIAAVALTLTRSG